MFLISNQFTEIQHYRAYLYVEQHSIRLDHIWFTYVVFSHLHIEQHSSIYTKFDLNRWHLVIKIQQTAHLV